MVIADLLKHKGSAVITIEPQQSVLEAIDSLAEHRVGALVVTDEGVLVGIISERDIVGGLHARGHAVLSADVGALMTSPVVSCSITEPLEDVAALMTQRRFRHLPVVQDGALVGIVTIGDVVAARIRQLETDRNQLETYISQGR